MYRALPRRPRLPPEGRHREPGPHRDAVARPTKPPKPPPDCRFAIPLAESRTVFQGRLTAPQEACYTIL